MTADEFEDAQDKTIRFYANAIAEIELGRHEANAARAAAERALEEILDHYVALVSSGDAGFWDAEKEPVVIRARAVLQCKTDF